MKLSEAILLGMKKYPKKAVGKLYGNPTEADALGCAYAASFCKGDEAVVYPRQILCRHIDTPAGL